VSAVAECDFVRGVFIGMHLGCWNLEVCVQSSDAGRRKSHGERNPIWYCISVTVLIYSI
jgi:hypothetical protein